MTEKMEVNYDVEEHNTMFKSGDNNIQQEMRPAADMLNFLHYKKFTPAPAPTHFWLSENNFQAAKNYLRQHRVRKHKT